MMKRFDSLLLRFHEISKQFTATEIVTFGLIFYGLSVFFNRSDAASGLFGSMQRYSGIDQEIWAIFTVVAVVLIRLGFSHPLQLVSALVLFAIMGYMWWSVWRAGLNWQGVLVSTVCAIACVKSSFDDMIADILVRHGKL